MSTFNNRSTNALNIHKQFSTLELSKGNDCVSSEWNRSVDGKIKNSDIPLGIGKLIGPKVSAAGKTCLNGSNTIVEIPALLGNTFDLDRDVTTLRAEVSNVLSTLFMPSEYRIVDFIMEGTFSDGKVLLKLLF